MSHFKQIFSLLLKLLSKIQEDCEDCCKSNELDGPASMMSCVDTLKLRKGSEVLLLKRLLPRNVFLTGEKFSQLDTDIIKLYYYFYNYSAFLTIIINHVTVTFDLSTNIVSTNKKLKHPCRHYDIVRSFKFILKVGVGESIENAPLV
jgi:hypothetical protein